MSAALDRDSHDASDSVPPSRESGVRSRIRQEDIDTLPPPPPDAEDVHRRDTVNQKMSPELLAYLRSFDAPAVPLVPVADPINPVPWSAPVDDGPVIEVGEEADDEAAVLGEQPAVSFEAAIEDDEIPSYRDHRATFALIGAAVLVAGVVSAFFLA
jgi:hypothetical protein